MDGAFLLWLSLRHVMVLDCGVDLVLVYPGASPTKIYSAATAAAEAVKLSNQATASADFLKKSIK